MPGIKPVKAGWWNAMRPWTLHGAVVPVLIGGAVAYTENAYDILAWAIFVMILISGCLLQSAANLLNTYGDFKKGTDTVENETRSPELVTGVLKPEKVKYAGMACLGVTCLFGLVFIWYSGLGILVYGVLGLIGAGMYTTGASYKYLGLGQASVFLMMGILMPLGTYFVMEGAFSWTVLLIGLPNAFMITAVLCGNELRDYEDDHKANVGTLAGRFSYENAKRLYLFENAVSFPILVILTVLGVAPWTCLLALVSLFDMWRLWKNSKSAPGDAEANFMLVPLSFRLNWHFGVLLVVGYLIAVYVIPVI